MDTQTPQLSKKEVKAELWRRGVLSWKLDSTQKELYELFYQSDHRIMTWLLSRRQGKSYSLCVLALEQCIKHPNSIVKFVSPTKLQVNNNVRPLFRQILDDCPPEIAPEFKQKDYIYYFPNGSEIQLAGTDNGHAEKLRGGDSHLWFIDEAGSCDDLNNVVKSILLPTTLTTKGKGILASTPPKEAEHEFLKYIEDAEMRGSLIKKTVFDNPRITKEELNDLIYELGGLQTSEARRELLCEIMKDESTVVLPEFNEELEKEIVKEWPKPPFFDCYEAMDLGFDDLTAVVFGYYDFRSDKIIIEDELPFDFTKKDKHLELLVKKIQEKEEELWKNPLTGEIKEPVMRVSDINKIVTNEIHTISKGKLHFFDTKKDDKDSALNNLRILLSNKKIIIHPRCKTLIRHLKNVKWGKGARKDKFAHSVDGSHYDFVDAMVYFVRSVHFGRNPYPSGYDMDFRKGDLFVRNPDNYYAQSSQTETYRKIFGMKRKK